MMVKNLLFKLAVPYFVKVVPNPILGSSTVKIGVVARFFIALWVALEALASIPLDFMILLFDEGIVDDVSATRKKGEKDWEIAKRILG